MFKIFDTRNQTVLRNEYATRKAAQRRCDRLDNDYGAYRYFVVSERIAVRDCPFYDRNSLTCNAPSWEAVNV